MTTLRIEHAITGRPVPDPAKPAMQAAGAFQLAAKAQNGQLCIAPTAASQRSAAVRYRRLGAHRKRFVTTYKLRLPPLG